MGMDISGLGSMYTDYLSETVANEKTSQLKGSVKTDYTNASDEELLNACKEFETYFVEQMFKEMQKTVPKTEYSSSATSTMVDYMQDSMIQQIAADSTEQDGLGLAKMLFEQMKRNYDL